MSDLDLLIVPAMALAIAAFFVWDTRRATRRLERAPAKSRPPAE